MKCYTSYSLYQIQYINITDIYLIHRMFKLCILKCVININFTFLIHSFEILKSHYCYLLSFTLFFLKDIYNFFVLAFLFNVSLIYHYYFNISRLVLLILMQLLCLESYNKTNPAHPISTSP